MINKKGSRRGSLVTPILAQQSSGENDSPENKEWNTPESVRRLYYNSNSNSLVVPPSNKDRSDRQLTIPVQNSDSPAWYNQKGELRANTIRQLQREGEDGYKSGNSEIFPHEREYLEHLLQRDIKDWGLSQKRSHKQELDDLFAGADDFSGSLMYITIPYVKKPWNYVFGIINFVLPGIGTILATLFGKHYTNMQLILGFFQLLTTPLIIGWFFSIAWGIQIIVKPYKNSRNSAQQTHIQLQQELKKTIVRAIVIGQTGERYDLDDTVVQINEGGYRGPVQLEGVEEHEEEYFESSSYLHPEAFEDYKAKKRVADFFLSDKEEED